MTNEQSGHTCCWHGTGVILTSNPPCSVEVCCHCGEKRSLQINQYFEPGKHGKFAPGMLRNEHAPGVKP